MKKITFFNNNADSRYAGRMFDLFPVKWDSESHSWIQCDESNVLGINAPGIGINPFFHDPSLFGVITEE
jgi:hypothetical protein